jgi:hypothetical protein
MGYREWNGGMCKQCVEIDKKINHLHRLAARMTDLAVLDGIKEVVDQAKAQKAALHPERGVPRPHD